MNFITIYDDSRNSLVNVITCIQTVGLIGYWNIIINMYCNHVVDGH
jgi:hypothetical protein